MAKPTEVPGLGPDTPLAIAAPLLVRARLDDVRRHEPAVEIEDGEPDMDAVHDMRVATRRLRAAISLLGRQELGELEPMVRALQDALGEVRDVQVQRRWLAERGADGGALVAWTGNGLPRALRRLRRSVRVWAAAVAPELAGANGWRGGRLGGRKIARELDDRVRTLKRRLRAARRDPAARPAHRLRIAAKKLRYVAELATPGFPAAEDVVEVLAPLQDRLGALHDTDVRLERLTRLAREGKGRERAEARGLLAPLARERARQARALSRELERWRAERVVRGLRRGLSGRGKRRARAAPAARAVNGAAGAAAGAA